MRIKGREPYTEGCIDKFRPVLHRQCERYRIAPNVFITKSKFDHTKYYTKSRLLNPFILHEIKGKDKHCFFHNPNFLAAKIRKLRQISDFLSV